MTDVQTSQTAEAPQSTQQQPTRTGGLGAVRRGLKDTFPSSRLDFIKGFSIFIAIVLFPTALVLLILWGYVKLVFPTQLDRVTTAPLDLSNGQTLLVDYPHVIPADNQPVTIRLILQGTPEEAGVVSFLGELSDGLRVETPTGFAYTKGFTLAVLVDQDGEPDVTSFTLVNASRQVTGCWRCLWQPASVTIRSAFLEKSVQLPIQSETVFGFSLRNFIDTKVDEKSPLILISLGLISTASALFSSWYQFERKKKEDKDQLEQKEKEARERRVKEIVERLVRINAQLHDQPGSGIREYFEFKGGLPESEISEAKLYFTQLEQKFLHASVREKLVEVLIQDLIVGEIDLTRLLAHTMGTLEPGTSIWNELKILASKIQVIKTQEDSEIEQVRLRLAALLACHPNHSVRIRKLVSNQLKEWAQQADQILLFYEIVHKASNTDLGYLVKEIISNDSLAKLASENHLTAKQKDAIAHLRKWLVQPPTWPRSVFEAGEAAEMPKKLGEWLAGFPAGVLNRDHLPFGYRKAEQDPYLMERFFEHPILGKTKAHASFIVFAEPGMGRTATALKHVQALEGQRGEGAVFPLYSRLFLSSFTLPASHWLAQQSAIQFGKFIALNPHCFLDSSSSSKAALSRLWMQFAGELDALKQRFYTWGLAPGTMSANICAEVERFTGKHTPVSWESWELVDVLCAARIDGYGKTEFFIDIQNASEVDAQTVERLDALYLLALQLDNKFSLKIFAPAFLKISTHLPSELEQMELFWQPGQLLEIFNCHIELAQICLPRQRKHIENRLAEAACGSPQRMVSLGQRLLRVACETLPPGGMITKSVLEQVLQENK